MEWSWTAWAISVIAVLISGAIAWGEGHWSRRAGLAMGFVNHGGMWSDLVLLSMANAVIVPHLTVGPWLVVAVIVTTVASLWVHVHWYHPPSPTDSSTGFGETGPASPEDSSAAFDETGPPSPADSSTGFGEPSYEHDAVDFGEASDGGDHMWPTHAQASWWRDLSWAGWAHVVYVIGELTVLIGFLIHAVPADVVIFVAAIFTIHVPIGLLQPRWYRTGHIATVQEQPLLAPLLLALWAVTMVKL